MYLEIDEGFSEHRKTTLLIDILDDDNAPWMMVRLWSWACRSCPTGALTGMTPKGIERVAQYRPLDGKCYAAMVAAGFIDEVDGAPAHIHGWAERTGAAIKRMDEAAADKKLYRAHTAKKCGGLPQCKHCLRDGGATVQGQSKDGRQDKPTKTSPSPVLAKQSKAEEGESERASALPVPIPPAAPGLDDPEPRRAPLEQLTSSGVTAGADGAAAVLDGSQAWHWLKAFENRWCAKYQKLGYGGGAADAKACGNLTDILAALPPPERADAWGRRATMLAEFLGNQAPGVTRARHPFAFFVTEFNGLRVAQQAAKKPGVDAAARRIAETDRYLEDQAAERRRLDAARGGAPTPVGDLVAGLMRQPTGAT